MESAVLLEFKVKMKRVILLVNEHGSCSRRDDARKICGLYGRRHVVDPPGQ